MALVQVGGLRVVVVSIRQQCKDIAMFECFGIDIAAARSVIVKSRGHFRAAFDIFFTDDRIIEVDVPGLTTPILTRVPYRNVPDLKISIAFVRDPWGTLIELTDGLRDLP